MQKEIWKRVPNFEDYEISNTGKLISYRCKKPKLIKGSIRELGYLFYNLINKHNSRPYGAHVIVAMAFLDHTPCGMKLVVDHINNDTSDNRVENLQIISARLNTSKDRKGNSKYTGVCLNKNTNKWHSSIRVNGKLNHLGSFNCEIEAYKAYQTRLNQLIPS